MIASAKIICYMMWRFIYTLCRLGLNNFKSKLYNYIYVCLYMQNCQTLRASVVCLLFFSSQHSTAKNLYLFSRQTNNVYTTRINNSREKLWNIIHREIIVWTVLSVSYNSLTENAQTQQFVRVQLVNNHVCFYKKSNR